jgi:hypothetical protein
VLGNRPGANAAFTAGLAILPKALGERPSEAAERLRLLERLGRAAEAQSIAARLARIGYRSAA